MLTTFGVQDIIIKVIINDWYNNTLDHIERAQKIQRLWAI